MLSGDAAGARPAVGSFADDAWKPIPARVPEHRSWKSRRRTKSLTRALPSGRPGGGAGAAAPPPDAQGPPGVQLRAVAPQPDHGLAAPQRAFRFWVDELLWSQGRVAVELWEHVLREAGGLRTGGPSRQQERARRRWQLEQQLELGFGLEQGLGLQPRSPTALGPTLGSQHMDAWEVLWTKSTYAIPAARSMRPGQLVSAVIGLNSLTMKKRLLLTLRGGLGPEAAFGLMPRSFALPEELAEWEAWLRREQEGPAEGRQGRQQRRQGQHGRSDADPGGRGGDGLGRSLWILKTGQDAGKGLSLLPADQAVKYAREQRQKQQQLNRPGGGGGNIVGAPIDVPDGSDGGAAVSATGGSGGGRRFQLQVAQQYICDPLLIMGRKFHLRLWLLMTAQSPIRAYLHRRGLVLFSGEPYDKTASAAPSGGGNTNGCSTRCAPERPSTAACAAATAGSSSSSSSSSTAPFAPPASHVTNYAQNKDTLVWSLRQLAEHLGVERYAVLWRQLCASCGAALAAAAPSLAEAHAWLRPAVHEYGFQVLGVDFLLDERLRPWLLEFNSSPSIMVRHERDDARALVYEQKYCMLRDTWELVRGRVFAAEAEAGCEGWEVRALRAPLGGARWEAAHLGEYEPLMPYIS